VRALKKQNAMASQPKLNQAAEMLTVETIGRIRREHFLKGKTIKEIARDLNVSRNTVR
jgi:DNA-binding NarL/FixJ family response regulator